jgi:hypothetical protein
LIILVGWFVFVTASAQPAPGPPLIVPPTDQVSGAPPLSGDESAAAGFQGAQNRFFVVSSDARTGLINVTLIGTDGSTIGMPQVISDEPGSCPVVEKSVADPPVVAWVGPRDIRVRILNPNGSPRGPEVVVDTSLDPEFPPSCPSLSRFVHNGINYLLTWSKLDGVHGRILDISNASSSFAGNAFAIGGGVSWFTAAAFDYTTGHFWVVYSASHSVFGQLVRVNGTLVGAAFQIAVLPPDSFPLTAAVAFSPEATAGRFLVVWEEQEPISDFPEFLARSRIVGQRVNLVVDAMGGATLSLTGGTIDIDEPTTGRFEFKGPLDIVYSLALGQYMVVWHNPSTQQATGRLINLDGTIPRAPFTISVSPSPTGARSDPRVAWSETFTPVIISPSGQFMPNRMEYIALWSGDQGDVRFRFVDPHLDSDGDGLLDDWETGGTDLNNDGQIDAINDVNLVALEPNNPPNPLRKDVYLELDWMDCAVGGCASGDTHNHRLRDLDGNGVPDVVEQMVAAFARDHTPANVRNPDGSNGITLHVDYGQLGGGNAIADDQVNIVPANVKAANLDSRRRRIFHYAVSTHACCGGADLPGQFFWAGRGGSEQNLNDVIAIASNTFMHELGHTLGLHHGGGDDVNFKPNYLSVMNYGFVAGIPIVGGATPLLDFSNQILPPLGEMALNEGTGLGLAVGNQATIFTCPNGTRSTQPIVGSIDWNCNRRIDAGNVMVDVNGDGGLGVLNSFADWSNLFYNFRVIGNFSSSAFMPPRPDNPNSVPPPEDLPSPEEIRQSLAEPLIEIRMTARPQSALPGLPILFVVEVENSGLGLAQNVTLVTQFGDRIHRFSLGALPPEDSAKRVAVFIVPREPEAATLTFATTVHLEDALNGPLPSVMRSIEVPVLRYPREPD